MTTDIDPRVARALDVLAPMPTDAPVPFPSPALTGARAITTAAPWQRVARAKVLLPLAAALAAVLLVAPALGINLPIFDFSTAPSASDQVVKAFDEFANTGAPAGMSPEALADQTREIETLALSDGAHTLWVAPTKGGGMCAEWSKAFAGCDALGTTPLALSIGSTGDGSHHLIGGSISLAWATTVEIHIAGGATIQPKLLLVSEPINRGFFLFDLPMQKRVESVAAINANGEAIATQFIDTAGAVTPSPDALVAKKVEAAKVDTSTGSAVVWQAPTAYGGVCRWLQYEGKNYDIGPCEPHGVAVNQFGVRTVQTRDAVLIAGTLDDNRFDAVDIDFADGVETTITPVGGVVLAAVAQDHLKPLTGATKLVARGRGGTSDVEIALPTEGCGSALPASGCGNS